MRAPQTRATCHDEAVSTVRKIFVHGNPETPAIWGPLIEQLEERGVTGITTVSPPGFGAPLPDDFDATAESYANWLIDELVSLGATDQPVDLVGHDWGAGHVFRVVAERPDLIRTWAADVAGLLHDDYQWHDAAQAWMTPDLGEQVIDMMVSPTVDERAAGFADLGLTLDIATDIAQAVDADMGRAILALYRSAPEPELHALRERLQQQRHDHGLVLNALDDAYVSAALSSEVARQLGAGECPIEGAGHWWMVSHPQIAADALVEHWARPE